MHLSIMLSVLAVATGVLVTGPCPVLPPSHKLPNISITYRVIGKASYSKFNSYLFGKRVQESCEVTLFGTAWISMSERHSKIDCPMVHGSLTNISASKLSNRFMAKLHLKNKGINGTIYNSEVSEVLQVYLLGNVGIIVTSCQDLPSPNWHDVGLLVGLIGSTSQKKGLGVKQIILKYFGRTMVDQLMWEVGLLTGNETMFCRVPHNCISILTSTRQKAVSRGIYKYVLIIALSFILLGIYKTLKAIICRYNTVNPVLS